MSKESCQRWLAEQGRAYPRTCQTCGLFGSCPFGLPSLKEQAEARQKQEEEAAEDVVTFDPLEVKVTLPNGEEETHVVDMEPKRDSEWEAYQERLTWKTGVAAEVAFGSDDYNFIGLKFTVRMGEGTSFSARFPVERLREVIEATGITDNWSRLNGWPVYYTVDDHIGHFKGFWHKSW